MCFEWITYSEFAEVSQKQNNALDSRNEGVGPFKNQLPFSFCCHVNETRTQILSVFQDWES